MQEVEQDVLRARHANGVREDRVMLNQKMSQDAILEHLIALEDEGKTITDDVLDMVSEIPVIDVPEVQASYTIYGGSLFGYPSDRVDFGTDEEAMLEKARNFAVWNSGRKYVVEDANHQPIYITLWEDGRLMADDRRER